MHTRSSYDALTGEKALLLDPAHEESSPHMIFDEHGRVSAVTGKGRLTIAALELNRPDIVRNRASVAFNTNKLLEDTPRAQRFTTGASAGSNTFLQEEIAS